MLLNITLLSTEINSFIMGTSPCFVPCVSPTQWLFGEHRLDAAPVMSCRNFLLTLFWRFGASAQNLDWWAFCCEELCKMVVGITVTWTLPWYVLDMKSLSSYYLPACMHFCVNPLNLLKSWRSNGERFPWGAKNRYFKEKEEIIICCERKKGSHSPVFLRKNI